MVSGWGLHFTYWVRVPTCHVGAFTGGRVGPLQLLALKLSLKYSWELDMKSCCCYCSVAKSYPTLRHHGLQHTRPPCPSPSPGACSNSSIESVMPSNHLSLCCPLLLLPSIFPSIRVFSNESTLHIRWPKYWSFSFSISPSSEYSELISWRRKWQPTPVPLPRKAW